MNRELKIYNSLSGEKEIFKPITEGYVGMYVCGPTVYNDVHMGNCMTFVRFDMIYRYLVHLGYKVRYVRNITDVGHLLDDGEDRILKGAKAEKLEPMEVVQKYSNGFHHMMEVFNTKKPSIEPRATAHIIEQIEMVEQIINNGYAYEANGSVYFDTLKLAEDTGEYGKLSGRKIEDLKAESRDNLKNQEDKRHPSDFAIWMKAAPEHIMKWNSPWSEGFPGWHLECSAMSTKYLGERFDIHGGGNDLKFPHHENEIAQNMGSCGCSPVNYWLHTNMLLMNGKKMSKSDGNSIMPPELFSGESEHISKGYSPMVVRFFFLQSHYRSTSDLSDSVLQAAEKGYKRFMEGLKTLSNIQGTAKNNDSAINKEILDLVEDVYKHMDDDFNTPRAIASIFEIVTKINSLKSGKISLAEISQETLNTLQSKLKGIIFDVFGLMDDTAGGAGGEVLDGLMQLVIELRQEARESKNWGISDKIRDSLKELEIQIKDGKDGTTWSI